MLADYKPFVDRMITRYEGGYCWDKRDPGGPTKYGITCYDYAEERGQPMTSMAKWAPLVQAMQLHEAEDIYEMKYATAIEFNALPRGVDVAMFDYAVNSGCARPIRVARALLSLGAGGMDSVLINALYRVDATDFINKLCDERLRFMHSIRGGTMWAEFGHGWGARVADVRACAVSIASTGNPNPAPNGPDLSHVVQPKAKHVAKTAGKPTAGGAVVAGGAVHSLGYGWVPTAVAVGAILVGGVAYELYQEKKTDALNNLVHL